MGRCRCRVVALQFTLTAGIDVRTNEQSHSNCKVAVLSTKTTTSICSLEYYILLRTDGHNTDIQLCYFLLISSFCVGIVYNSILQICGLLRVSVWLYDQGKFYKVLLQHACALYHTNLYYHMSVLTVSIHYMSF